MKTKNRRVVPEWQVAAKARARAFVEECMARPEMRALHGTELAIATIKAKQGYHFRQGWKSECAVFNLAKACRFLAEELPTDTPERQALADATRAFVVAAERCSMALAVTELEIGDEFSRRFEADCRLQDACREKVAK
jgi:hypothetical protein